MYSGDTFLALRKTGFSAASLLALCAALLALVWAPATAEAQTFPIDNHTPEFVSHTNNDSVFFHGGLSNNWSAAAVSYWEDGTPTDYDLGLHETTNGTRVTSSELGNISELIVIDGNNINAGTDYYLQVYHFDGPGGEFVEVSDAGATQGVNLGQNDLTVPADSIVRCYEAHLEAGRDYEFVMQAAQQQSVEAYGFLYAPTVGWNDYHDNLMGDDGFQIFGVDLDSQGTVQTFTAPVTGFYGFAVLLLHEVGVSTTYWVDVYDVTPSGGGGSTSIEVTPGSHSFSAVEGGSNPSSLTSELEIINGPDAWTATSNAAWLSVSPNNGNHSGTVPLEVSVDIDGLSAGSYSATIWIDAQSATNSPQRINVALEVSPSDPGGGDNGGDDENGDDGGSSVTVGSGGSCATGVDQGGAPLAALLALLLLSLAAVRRRLQ